MSKQEATLVFATMAACALASAASGGQDPEPVTDPRALAAMVLAPTARNVFACRDRLNQPLTASSEPQEYWGTSASGFSTYVGQAFKPEMVVPDVVMWRSEFDAGDIRPGNGDHTFQVQLADIPNGARLQALRWWAFDSNPTSDMTFAVHQICQPNVSAGPPTIVVLGTQSTSGSAGDQSAELTLNLPTVDAKTCVYRARVNFGAADASQVLYKVRAQWIRQVSPAPASARFIDVPPNHPFFRFVEALAASGITGGCSGNQFCPDSAVTRGQMAVFLATALGLNWGGL